MNEEILTAITVLIAVTGPVVMAGIYNYCITVLYITVIYSLFPLLLASTSTGPVFLPGSITRTLFLSSQSYWQSYLN